jgi:hypothetical protein
MDIPPFFEHVYIHVHLLQYEKVLKPIRQRNRERMLYIICSKYYGGYLCELQNYVHSIKYQIQNIDTNNIVFFFIGIIVANTLIFFLICLILRVLYAIFVYKVRVFTSFQVF